MWIQQLPSGVDLNSQTGILLRRWSVSIWLQILEQFVCGGNMTQPPSDPTIHIVCLKQSEADPAPSSTALHELTYIHMEEATWWHYQMAVGADVEQQGHSLGSRCMAQAKLLMVLQTPTGHCIGQMCLYNKIRQELNYSLRKHFLSPPLSL